MLDSAALEGRQEDQRAQFSKGNHEVSSQSCLLRTRGGARRRVLADQDEDQGRSGLAQAYRKAGPILDASWQLVGSVGFGTLVGYWLDRKFDTTPWLLIAGSVLGMTAGMFAFIRVATKSGRRQGPGRR